MGNKGGDVEEDAGPATPDENPARSSITGKMSFSLV